GDRGTARLLDNEGDRVGFVKQAETTSLLACALVVRVEKDTAARQDAVGLGDQRGDPAHAEILATHAFLAGHALLYIAAYWRLPEALVGGVDREGGCFSGNGDLRMGQHELANFAVEREAIHAESRGEDQARRSAVLHEAGTQHFRTGLEK